MSCGLGAPFASEAISAAFFVGMKERGKSRCSHIAAGLIFLFVRLNIIVCVRRGGSGAMTESGEGRVAAAMKEEDFVKNKELGASYSHPRAGGESDEPKTYKFVDSFCFKKAGVSTTGRSGIVELGLFS
jgi:hypothetical protein